MFLENILSKISKIIVENGMEFDEMDIIIFQDFIDIQFMITAIYSLSIIKSFEKITDDVNILISQIKDRSMLSLTIWK